MGGEGEKGGDLWEAHFAWNSGNLGSDEGRVMNDEVEITGLPSRTSGESHQVMRGGAYGSAELRPTGDSNPFVSKSERLPGKILCILSTTAASILVT